MQSTHTTLRSGRADTNDHVTELPSRNILLSMLPNTVVGSSSTTVTCFGTLCRRGSLGLDGEELVVGGAAHPDWDGTHDR